MKCPSCEKEGKKSKVYEGIVMSTAIAHHSGYFDEEGVWKKCDDPNTHSYQYNCSNGHEFWIKNKLK